MTDLRNSPRRAATGTALVAIALACSTLPVTAQVVAEQGTVPIRDEQEFSSPMVLTFPLPNLSAYPAGGAYNVPGIEKYYCDDMHFTRLAVARPVTKRTVTVIAVDGTIFVRPSFDRLCRFIFQLQRGEEQFTTVRTAPVDCEEGQTRPVRAKLELNAEAAARAFKPGEPLSLRVTVSVEEN